ncbi:hypothetical protein ABZ570_07630 [Micromonospora sp. NPDC007271]|uniref:hypothetical protein n=1 Tax=Micromonospora sp. NPDC007271 TaxID=3154587 RepID=UPI0033D82AED
MSEVGTPTINEIFAAMRDTEVFAELMETYELTEDDLLARVRVFSHRITEALESRPWQ